jgi:hypothetical protein
MNINGVNYDSYLAELAQVQTISTQQNNVQSGGTESEKDSYISSAASADIAIPSGIYGADGVERTVDSVYGAITGTVGTQAGETIIGSTGAEASGAAVGTQASGSATETAESGGVGGGVSSDSEEMTETEVVTINGVTYLQTTTTDESGNMTVTRTQIGAADDQK